MSDLIERLRKHCNTDEGHYWTGPIMAEAADEIERLRGEVDVLIELLRKERTKTEREATDES